MSQGSKSAAYRAVKAAGVQLDKHYREYTTEELQQLATDHGVALPPTLVAAAAPARPDEMAEIKEQLAGFGDLLTKLATIVVQQQASEPQPEQPRFPPPAAEYSSTGPLPQPEQPKVKPTPQGLDPMKHAGVTLNTHTPDEVIRVDEAGNQWYQNEVNKPGYAKPRGRRIYRDVETGTQEQTIKTKDGYTETFEIPGDPAHTRPLEVKITLPSYQTGIFKAPGMPFKIHIYQGNRGFDWDDVNRYYGGPDLVPDTIKRVYVSSDLCYDMQSTIRAINDEYRERVLKKETLR